MTEALVGALEKANSFAHAKTVLGLIEGVPSFSSVQLDRLRAAVKENNQVEGTWGASDRVEVIVARHRPETASEPKPITVDDIPF